MTTARRSAQAGVAALLVLLIGGCGLFTTSVADGAKTAGRARPAVWGQFWDVIGALRPTIDTTSTPVDGEGRFVACGKADDRVQYSVWTTFGSQDRKIATRQFMATMEQTLHSGGWNTFVPDPTIRLTALKPGPAARSAKGDYHAYLQQDLLGDGELVHLAVAGPCVKVGKAFTDDSTTINSHLRDDYPITDAPSRPVPTSPVPTS
jgi:hypothetical protein